MPRASCLPEEVQEDFHNLLEKISGYGDVELACCLSTVVMFYDSPDRSEFDRVHDLTHRSINDFFEATIRAFRDEGDDETADSFEKEYDTLRLSNDMRNARTLIQSLMENMQEEDE